MALDDAVDDCQKFARRLVGAYPVTGARPEISRGREKNDKTVQGSRFPVACMRADDFPGKMGRAVPACARARGPTLATRKVQNSSKHPWQGVRSPVIFGNCLFSSTTHAAVA